MKIFDRKNIHVVQHPLVQHKLSLLRDKKTTTKAFKELIDEITMLLAYEATQSLPLTTREVQTPMETFQGPILAGKKQVILPILRAGIGMVDGFLKLMPSARVGHIGIFRDEKTLQPNTYFFKIPENSQERHFFVCDPMLATGGSAIAAVNQLKLHHIHKITFVCLVCAPEGLAALTHVHPDIEIFTASIDQGLNSKGYIIPGLGDAGDRLFGTS